MKILSIETSCDETAVSIVEATGDFPDATYRILGNALFSQIDIHREYGGVFPAVAKREHAKTLVPMLEKAFAEAGFSAPAAPISPEQTGELHTILYREPTLGESLVAFLERHGKPDVDLIAVTAGPGLEPTLWVGINFARALSYIWNIPVVPVNHMEGHILSSVFSEDKIPPIEFPALALLISGGHTELDLMESWGKYTCIGETRDDAVGEAFDKVARMLNLPYPGGPEIGKRAEIAREKNLPQFAKLPYPMLKVKKVNGEARDAGLGHAKGREGALGQDTPGFEFSFSGLKTAVRYAIGDKVNAESREGALGYKVNAESREGALGHKVNAKGREGALGHKVNAESREGALGYRKLSDDEISALARDFEDVVVEVLLRKSQRAIDAHGAKTLIVGGGVSANTRLRQIFSEFFAYEYPDLALYLPPRNLSTDNSVMIALAGHSRVREARTAMAFADTKADGNLSLSE